MAIELSRLQALAEHYAAKLGVDCPVVVKWAEKPCKLQREAHCHIIEGRGTICVKPSLRVPSKTRWPGIKGWQWIKWLMAHEVCHLKVGSHSSPYFKRYMASSGFKMEKRQAQAAGLIRHRHEWTTEWLCSVKGNPFRHCKVCNATQEGKITWGPTRKKL